MSERQGPKEIKEAEMGAPAFACGFGARIVAERAGHVFKFVPPEHHKGVLPIKVEPMGKQLLEGLETGLPALATTLSRREEAARHGKPNDAAAVEAEEGVAF